MRSISYRFEELCVGALCADGSVDIGYSDTGWSIEDVNLKRAFDSDGDLVPGAIIGASFIEHALRASPYHRNAIDAAIGDDEDDRRRA